MAEYALGSRVFSDAVERLRRVNTNAEAFIHVLGEVGVANRNCERIRRRLNRHLMQNRLSPDSSL